jgi:hypothetical protein
VKKVLKTGEFLVDSFFSIKSPIKKKLQVTPISALGFFRQYPGENPGITVKKPGHGPE